MIQNVEYSNFISLGFFCGVASELKRYGLRKCSSPFDWCISPWQAVESCIDNYFQDFLDYGTMKQSSKRRECYKNKYDIEFYHDFVSNIPLKRQFDAVKKKYDRRIERFYINIQQPTLFFRYVMSDDEMRYFEKNHGTILKKLRNHNQKNDIILIANNDMRSEILPVYYVEKDVNDTVAREFIDKNDELCRLFKNLKVEEAYKVNDNFIRRIFYRIKNKISRSFLKEYIHSVQYDD